jgi:hypothetical protein
MAQATNNLQHRIDTLDRKLTSKQLQDLKSLVRLLGFDLKPIKPQAAPQTGKPKLKSKWYRPQTLAALASGPSTATNLTAIAWERVKENYVLGVGGPWPSDIAAHYEALSHRRAA